MATNDSIAGERCVRVARTLYASLGRSQLQDALLSSKLLGKSEERAPARKICADEQSWNHFVAQQFSSDVSAEGAIRMLGSLIDLYVNQLDSAMQSAFHKALKAAEKDDGSKINSEIEKLKRASGRGGKRVMDDPAAYLWLCASSPVVRDRILQHVNGKRNSIAMQCEPASLGEPVVSNGFHPPGEARSQSERSTLLRTLRELAREPERRNWDLDALRGDIHPPGDRIDWPDLSSLAAAFADLKTSAAALAQNQVTPTIESLPDTLEYLARLSHLGEEAKSVAALVRTVQDSAQEIVAKTLASLPPSFAARAATLRDSLLDRSRWPQAIQDLSALIADAGSEWNATVANAFSIAHTIEAGAAFLPDATASSLAERVRSFLIDLNVNGLEELAREHEPDWNATSKVREHVCAPATTAVRLIEADERNIPEFVRNYCVTLVKNGNTQGVRDFLEHFFAESPKPKPEDISVDAHIPAEHSSEIDTVSADISRYTPRNRRTAAGPLPADPTELLRHLYERAIEEMRAGSVAGVAEHALDILEIVAKGAGATHLWVRTAITLLAAPPASPGIEDAWGPALAECIKPMHSPAALQSALEGLLSSTGFDDAVAERFVVPEITPFAEIVAGELYRSSQNAPVPVIEDVARAIGYGVRYGDANAGKRLLVELARAAGAKRGGDLAD